MRRLEWSTIMDLQWLLRNLPERATEPPPGCLHLGSPSRLAFALSSPAPFFLWPGGWGSPFPVSWQLPFFATASARADGLSLLLGNTTLLPCSRRAHFFFAIQWLIMFHICQTTDRCQSYCKQYRLDIPTEAEVSLSQFQNLATKAKNKETTFVRSRVGDDIGQSQ